MATAKSIPRATKPAVAAKRRTASPASTVAAPAARPAKEEKPKKPKLVRDSFTIPKTEYGVLDSLKLRAGKLGKPAKKSELLRAGIKLLEGASDAAFSAALAAVPAIKTGRPSKG